MYRTLTIVTGAASLMAALYWWRRLTPPQDGATAAGRFPRLEKLSAGGLWICFIGVAATGNGYASLCGHALSGYPLLLHVSLGLGLACCLAVLLFLQRAVTLGAATPRQAAHFSLVQEGSVTAFAAGNIALVLWCCFGKTV